MIVMEYSPIFGQAISDAVVVHHVDALIGKHKEGVAVVSKVSNIMVLDALRLRIADGTLPHDEAHVVFENRWFGFQENGDFIDSNAFRLMGDVYSKLLRDLGEAKRSRKQQKAQ